MIRRALDEEGLRGWIVVPLPDTGVHAVWVSHVLSLVPLSTPCTRTPRS